MRSRRRFCGILLLVLSVAGPVEAEEFDATQAEIDAWVGADTNGDAP